MRTKHVLALAVTLGFGLGACGSDEPEPGDEILARGETPEIDEVEPAYTAAPLDGEVLGDEYQALACRVKLVYCADPRWTPRYPSYCSNGCTVAQRFNASRSLCRDICGNINCSTMYYLGGC